jgi:histidyl-tRNA synthetase
MTIPMGTAGPAAAMKAAWMLRRAGLRVRNGTAGRSARAQLRSADTTGARFVIIIGDVEVTRGFAQLRRMDGKVQQQQVTFENLADVIANWVDEPDPSA